jgi:hypothetical protein
MVMKDGSRERERAREREREREREKENLYQINAVLRLYAQSLRLEG